LEFLLDRSPEDNISTSIFQTNITNNW